jgi:hypothetical protein
MASPIEEKLRHAENLATKMPQEIATRFLTHLRTERLGLSPQGRRQRVAELSLKAAKRAPAPKKRAKR